MVRTKVKTKPTTPPAPALAVALTPLAAFAGPVALGAITMASGPPTVMRGLVTLLAIKQLAREIAVLPLSRLVPLKDAAKLASDRLGSYELAARDLVQRARTRQLMIVAQVTGRDERVFLLRPEFWRWYRIVWSRSRPDEGRPEVFVDVDRVHDNRVRTVGRWDFFVGRRRLERLYSVSPPSKPVTKPKDKKSDGTERYGMPPPGRSRTRKRIQDFALGQYGSGWASVTIAAVRQAASKDEDFMKQGPLPDRTTFGLALGHKKARKKARKKD